jgi:hypothetical protein
VDVSSVIKTLPNTLYKVFISSGNNHLSLSAATLLRKQEVTSMGCANVIEVSQ